MSEEIKSRLKTLELAFSELSERNERLEKWVRSALRIDTDRYLKRKRKQRRLIQLLIDMKKILQKYDDEYVSWEYKEKLNEIKKFMDEFNW